MELPEKVLELHHILEKELAEKVALQPVETKRFQIALQPVEMKLTEVEMVPVTLCIYEIKWLTALTSVVGRPAFHVGIAVHGMEHSFGGAGIQVNKPGQFDVHKRMGSGKQKGQPVQRPQFALGYTHKESIVVGHCSMPLLQTRSVIRALRQQWLSDSYNILSCNCQTFVVAYCKKLGLGANCIPEVYRCFSQAPSLQSRAESVFFTQTHPGFMASLFGCCSSNVIGEKCKAHETCRGMPLSARFALDERMEAQPMNSASNDQGCCSSNAIGETCKAHETCRGMPSSARFGLDLDERMEAQPMHSGTGCCSSNAIGETCTAHDAFRSMPSSARFGLDLDQRIEAQPMDLGSNEQGFVGSGRRNLHKMLCEVTWDESVCVEDLHEGRKASPIPVISFDYRHQRL